MLMLFLKVVENLPKTLAPLAFDLLIVMTEIVEWLAADQINKKLRKIHIHIMYLCR